MTALRQEHPTLSVTRLCTLLGISRSSWYAWLKAPTQAERDADLVARIQTIVARYRRYGYRRVLAVLQRSERPVGKSRVQRVMRTYNLGVKKRKRRTTTTVTSGPSRYAPNRLRGLAVTRCDQVWVTDVTFLTMPRGFVYLACVLDRWSRRCLGWAVDWHLTTNLVLTALNTAIALRHPAPGLILHSDQGTTYTSLDYQARLSEIGAVCSMSAKGTPVENAVIESFFSTLKQEEVDWQDYQTLTEAEQLLQQFIVYYNRDRHHSSLGNEAPITFELAEATSRQTEL